MSAVVMGEQHIMVTSSACFTEEQVVAKREVLATGKFSLREMVPKWGESASCIYKFAGGKSYRWVGGPITHERINR